MLRFVPDPHERMQHNSSNQKVVQASDERRRDGATESIYDLLYCIAFRVGYRLTEGVRFTEEISGMERRSADASNRVALLSPVISS